MKNDRNILSMVAAMCGFNNVHVIRLHNYTMEQPLVIDQFNAPPRYPTPGSNRKAAKRRSGIQYRHGKAARS